MQRANMGAVCNGHGVGIGISVGTFLHSFFQIEVRGIWDSVCERVNLADNIVPNLDEDEGPTWCYATE